MMFWCRVRGHDWEEESRKTTPMRPPQVDHEPPEPEPGYVFVEVFNQLHWITAIEKVVKKCRRCGETEVNTLAQRKGKPLDMPQWYKLQAPGRIITPP